MVGQTLSRPPRDPVVSCKVVLRNDVEFTVDQGDGVFVRDETEYRLLGLSGQDVLNIISRLSGRASSFVIAEATKLPEPVVRGVMSQLVTHNLAVESIQDQFQSFSPQQFSEVCRRYFPVWKERLFRHSLWLQLGSGKAKRAQFLGWLLESFHFIEGVNDRLTMAIAESHDYRVRPLFASHYAEEYDHSHFFMKSLNAFGVEAPAVLSSRPLPSTLAILNFMRLCARRDPLQYAVCSGFLESTGTDRKRARSFYAYLSKHYSSDQNEMIQPLVDHVGLDEEYGHNDLLEQIVDRIGNVPAARASAALGAGKALMETLELWSTDIERTYDRPQFCIRGNNSKYRPSMSRTVPIDLSKVTG